MRKLILLFTVLAFGVTLTSCLDGGSNSITMTQDIVYIDYNSSETFGFSQYHGYISAEKISTMSPKNFYIFGYNWDEDNGYKNIGNIKALNVNVTTNNIKIDKTSLIPRPYTEPLEGEAKFGRVEVALQSSTGMYIDDNWLLYYTYKGKKKEESHVTFYQREANSEKPNVVEIDVILTKTGQPEEGASEEDFRNYVAVDMSPLRQAYISNGTTDELEIKLYYNYDEEKKESTEIKGYNDSSFKMIKPKTSDSSKN